MSDLTGKTALITGGTRGIGAAMAEGFAKAGAKVVIAGRNEDHGAEAAARLGRHGPVRFTPLDITDEAQWIATVDAVVASEGGLDVLVNNAGALEIRPLAQTGWEDFERLYRINVEGAFLGIREAFRVMGAAGSIINVASMIGVAGAANLGAYAASKGGLIGMSKAAALEGAMGGKRLRVNVIVPGLTRTDMARSFAGSDEAVSSFGHKSPLGRVGEVEDLVPTALYLASAASRYVTGQVFNVEGGQLAAA